MARWLIVFLIFLFSLLQIRLWTGERSFAEIAFLKDQIRFKKLDLIAKDIQNEVIRLHVEDLKTGTSIVEEIARSELMMLVPGETFVIMPRKTDGK